MNQLDALLALAGAWIGRNRLILHPGAAPDESTTTAVVVPLALGRFVRMDYTWSVQGGPAEGSLLIGFADGVAVAVWLDSWHTGRRMMTCVGSMTPEGGVDVRGSYPAPPDPDWGWRTILVPGGDGTMPMTMYNISPQGTEDLAVEAVYTRVT